MMLNVAHIFIIVVSIFVLNFFALYEYVLKKLHVFLCVYIVKIFFFQMSIFNYYMCTCYATMCEKCKNCVK
jgi:hypothetical protein